MKLLNSLKFWFKIHFLVDFLFALPLIFAAEWILVLFGFSPEGAVFARLVGAALVGIGGISLWVHQSKSVELFQTLLLMKIFWSLAAILGFAISLYQGAPQSTWIFLGIFAAFSALWMFYYKKLSAS